MAEASLQSVGKRFALTWDARGTAWRGVQGEITRSAVTLLTSGRLHRGPAMRRRKLHLALPRHKP